MKIDNYRKDKKNYYLNLLQTLRNNVKDLISLIEQAEQPIKEGISVFDDLKREEKRKVAERLIKEVIEEQELNEKYGSQVINSGQVLQSLTAKEKEVKDDLTSRAITLRVEQDREAELIDIIKDTIELEKMKRINTKLNFIDFPKDTLDRGIATKEILQEIKLRAESIYRAENPT